MRTKDDLGTRMKEFYESVPKTKLMRRTPVIIRVDGKAFHTFTRGLKKPFDEILMTAMQDTTKYLCENIQGCVCGYVQSDEISLILRDDFTLESSAWFDYEVQKMCSIAASMATFAFNKAFAARVKEWMDDFYERWNITPSDKEYALTLQKCVEKGAMFDARCFNIPREEAANYIYWRQLDAIRNSVQMVGHAYFSQKELHSKSCEEIKEMLLHLKGIDWEGLENDKKCGAFCIRKGFTDEADGRLVIHHKWTVDHESPVIKGDDREYIEHLVEVE